jgi:hypothetical protein
MVWRGERTGLLRFARNDGGMMGQGLRRLVEFFLSMREDRASPTQKYEVILLLFVHKKKNPCFIPSQEESAIAGVGMISGNAVLPWPGIAGNARDVARGQQHGPPSPRAPAHAPHHAAGRLRSAGGASAPASAADAHAGPAGAGRRAGPAVIRRRHLPFRPVHARPGPGRPHLPALPGLPTLPRSRAVAAPARRLLPPATAPPAAAFAIAQPRGPPALSA